MGVNESKKIFDTAYLIGRIELSQTRLYQYFDTLQQLKEPLRASISMGVGLSVAHRESEKIGTGQRNCIKENRRKAILKGHYRHPKRVRLQSPKIFYFRGNWHALSAVMPQIQLASDIHPLDVCTRN